MEAQNTYEIFTDASFDDVTKQDRNMTKSIKWIINKWRGGVRWEQIIILNQKSLKKTE